MNSDPNDPVVLSGKEKYREGAKKFIKNFLGLNNICVVEADYAISNPGIIERLEWEHRQGKNIIVVGGNRKERDFTEIISQASDFFRKERVFWSKNLLSIKELKLSPV